MTRITSITRLGSQRKSDNPPDSNQKLVGKFVLIESQDQLHFISGPIEEFTYHAGLVKKFCDMNDIPSGWVKKPDLYEIYGDNLTVKGGGWIEENPAQKQVNFYGYSTAYGGFDRKDILYLLQNDQTFEDYQVHFD